MDGRVDILTGTLGKALGGASGGYTAGPREIVDLLRQRSRPYLFSNTLAPAIAAASLRVLELLRGGEGALLRRRVRDNGEHFRREMAALGFTLVPGAHPIIPVMLGDAALADTDGRTRCSTRASTSSASPTRSCRRAGAHPHPDERRAHARTTSTRAMAAFAQGGPGAGRDRVTHSRRVTGHESTRQTRARAGPHAHPREEARGRPQRRADPDPQDGDLRHRHPHLEVGRLGAEDHSRADARRPRVRRRDRRDRPGGARLRHRRSRLRRGAHHLRLLPQLPRRAPAPVPQHRRRRRQPRRARSPSTW